MLTNQSKFDNMCHLMEKFYSQFFLSSKESLFEILIVHYELDVQHPRSEERRVGKECRP